mgnify:CR=1 FL=1
MPQKQCYSKQARNHPERSPTKSTTGFEPPNLAPIPEERYSFIEQQDAVSELKARNENLRSEFFKDLIPNNEIGSNSDYGSLKRKKQLISASLNSLLEKDRQTAANNLQLLPLLPGGGGPHHRRLLRPALCRDVHQEELDLLQVRRSEQLISALLYL